MLTQRLGSNTQKDPAFLDSFIRAVLAHPGCCDEVWLATDYGFPKPETHRRAAEILARQAEKLRAAGLRVSLQLSNSIGHGQYMASEDCSGLVYDGSPVGHMVGHDGTEAGYCFCWNDRYFRDYTVNSLREYVRRIRPYAVWADDDLRPTNHAPVSFGCFCPACIARFNARHGASFTREALIREFEHGDPVWKVRYTAFVRDGIADFTRELGRMIHEEAPECILSFQHGGQGGYGGHDNRFIMDAMKESTGHAPGSRPGGGSYNDHDPETFIVKMEDLEAQNRSEPDYVTEFRPEIESLPDVVYGKSIGGTCFETSYYLAGGNNAMSYAILMNDYEPMEWHEKMFAAFAAHRSYWERLAANAKVTSAAGWNLVLADEGRPVSPGFPGGYGEKHYRVAEGLLFDGFAIDMNRHAAPDEVRLLHAANAAELSDGEIDALLRVPVIADGGALRVLSDRGYEFPASAEEISVARLYERFTDHPVNGLSAGFLWGGPWGKSMDWALCPKDPNRFEPLSEYVRTAPAGTPEEDCIPVRNAGIKKYSPAGRCASAILTLPSGAKWAVFGFDFWGRTKSNAKRVQYLEASAAISGHRQPAEIVTPIQACLQARVDAAGRLKQASVTNVTVGDSGPLTLRIRKPAGTHAFWMGQYVPLEELTVTPGSDPDTVEVTVPNMKAWSVGTVFFEE
ncbi:MAG: DUF1929 domain-containing protein [Clostridiales bacterium]|nr:DUF1929 domain-containing protein [Clostridiales bacterium]